MSIIICKKHGESGFAQRISKEIVLKINADIPLDDDVKLIQINLYDGDDFLQSESFLVTGLCFEKINAGAVVNVNTEDEYDRFYKQLPEMGGVCFQCLQEYRKKHGVDLLDFN